MSIGFPENRNEKLKLNLGCGENIYTGYLNVDRMPLAQVNLVHDLEKIPLPFEDNSVCEIRCEHILEHITQYMPLISEIHRISIPGGRVKVLAPYYKYEGAYRDPTHVRFFTEHSFDYFQDGVKFSNYCTPRFKVLNVEKRVRFFSDIKNKRKEIMSKTPNFIRPFLDHFFWNIYSELVFDLEVVK